MKAVAARTTPPRYGRMNKLEESYAGMLRFDPDVKWWEYEPLSLRIGDGARYTPDFGVIQQDSIMVFIDTKGGKLIRGKWKPYCRSADSRVRIAVAAETHPWAVFKFAWPSRDKTHWLEEVFS